MPVLPLDGGNVVSTVIDRFIPGRGAAGDGVRQRRAHVRGAGVEPCLRADGQFTVFIGFLLLVQLAAVFDDRTRRARSPFDVAAAAMRRGDHDKGVRGS